MILVLKVAVLNFYFRVRRLFEVVDKMITDLKYYEAGILAKLTEPIDNGFISNDPEYEIMTMIYRQPSRRQVVPSARPEPTTQMVASLLEITVNQGIISKKNN